LQYEEQLHKKEKKVDDIKDSDEIQRIVSEAFIGETTKYIKTIYINVATHIHISVKRNRKLINSIIGLGTRIDH
jgi:hypothetical protein